MNKLANDIPNRIKQPALCCVHCGKSYVKRVNLNKHIIVCELLQRSKTSRGVKYEEEDDIPSQKKLFQMLIELGDKYNRLESKVDEMNKWVVKKKKKINVVDWLNSNIVPNLTFGDVIDTIIVGDNDANVIIEHNFSEILNIIFSRTIYNFNESESPIFAFVQKPNVFYIYNSEHIWVELTSEMMIKFLNRVHMKVIRAFYDWRHNESNENNRDDKFTMMCDKTLLKLMSVEFTNDNTLSRTKSAMYSRMKADMKALIEYEFEF